MTIAERHNLEPGDLCEIRVLPNVAREAEYAAYGVYRYTAASTSELCFDRGPFTSLLSLPPERIRSVQKVTGEHIAKQFHVGQRVRIRKYGGTYRGHITKVGRTRVTVAFTTFGGKDKEQTLPAWHLELAR